MLTNAMLWLGLGTHITWFELGKGDVLFGLNNPLEHGWRCPNVSLKTPEFVATNQVTDVPTNMFFVAMKMYGNCLEAP